MKKSVLMSIVLFAMITIIQSAPVHAIGFGWFVTGGEGFSDEDDCNTGREYDTERSGFGFLLDTTVARDTVFNYQLTIGFEEMIQTSRGYDYYSHHDDYELKLDGFYVGHTFGFGVVRTPFLRLWLGPEIRMSHYEIEQQYDEDHIFGFGIGPVMGMNMHLGPVVSLSLKGGLMMTEYTDYDCGDFLDEESYVFINGAIIFRVADLFSGYSRSHRPGTAR